MDDIGVFSFTTTMTLGDPPGARFFNMYVGEPADAVVALHPTRRAADAAAAELAREFKIRRKCLVRIRLKETPFG